MNRLRKFVAHKDCGHETCHELSAYQSRKFVAHKDCGHANAPRTLWLNQAQKIAADCGHPYGVYAHTRMCAHPPVPRNGSEKIRNVGDNRLMEDETTEAFAITYSTAYIGIAALLTMRDNEDDLFDDATVEYASKVLEYIRNQPDRVLNLEAEEMKMIGPYLVSDTRVWIDE